VLYLFWAFLAAVIILSPARGQARRLSLESERSAHITVQGFPAIPAPKTYLLADGTTVYGAARRTP
jgi:photosynthetic reaction center H subunit